MIGQQRKVLPFCFGMKRATSRIRVEGRTYLVQLGHQSRQIPVPLCLPLLIPSNNLVPLLLHPFRLYLQPFPFRVLLPLPRVQTPILSFSSISTINLFVHPFPFLLNLFLPSDQPLHALSQSQHLLPCPQITTGVLLERFLKRSDSRLEMGFRFLGVSAVGFQVG
jgi:hypothetical protein